jgi:hypothetical protein
VRSVIVDVLGELVKNNDGMAFSVDQHGCTPIGRCAQISPRSSWLWESEEGSSLFRRHQRRTRRRTMRRISYLDHG